MAVLWVYNSTPEVNAQSEYPLLVAGTIPLLVCMIITVGTRLYVRVRTVRGIGADDWTIVLAVVCAIFYDAFTVAQSRWGLGLPLALRPPQNLNTYSLVNYAGRPFYMIGLLGFKVSLCFSYLRILSMGQRYYRILVWIVMVLCILGHVIGTLVLMFNCHPVQKSWRPATTPGKCLPVGPLFYGLAITTVTFDIIIFFLPMPFLYSLRMDTRKKIGIIAAFALGLFTTGCSFMRMAEIPDIATGSGNSTKLVLWGNVELNIGIILTCLPVLAPLLKVFGRKLSSYGKSGSSNPYLPTTSYNMNVFTKQNTNTNTRAAKTSVYPGDVGDNESQETILGKDIEGIMRTVQIDVRSETRGVSMDNSGGEQGNR